MSDPNRKRRTLFLVGLFMLAVVAVIGIRLQGWITGQMALLMLVALLGMYVGFGILMMVYRMVVNLEENPAHRRYKPPEE